MGVLALLSAFDVLVIALLIAGLLFGAFQGLLRQMFFVAAVYLGMVLAAQYYHVAASGLAMALPGGDERVYSTVGLLLVFALGTLFVNALGYLTYRSTQVPKLAALDHVGGASLGLLSAYIVVSLIVTTADFALAMPLGGLEWAQDETARLLRQSTLVPLLHGSMPVLYETLRPWVPSGLPAPFTV